MSNKKKYIFYIFTALFFFISTTLFSAHAAEYGTPGIVGVLTTQVDVTFYESPISTVLAGLSEVFGFNLAISPSETSQLVTLNLNGVALKDVLNKLCILADLSWKFENNTLVVASKTKMKDSASFKVSSYSFAHRNAEDVFDSVEAIIKEQWTNAALKIDTGSNSIFVSSSEEDAVKILNILGSFDTPIDQVMIDVVFLEARVDENESGGFAWAWKEIPFSIEENLGKITRSGLQLDVTAQISSAIGKGMAKVLNSTRLLIQSGTEATLHSGENNPIITNNPETGPATEYKSTGVQLKVKPVIRRGGKIFMSMTPSFSEVTGAVKTQMTEAPITSDREVFTEAVLNDGEWFVIGGLMRDRISSTGQGIPFLKDLPLLGTLFKSSTESVSRAQTVVLIRPRIRNENSPLHVDEDIVFASSYKDMDNSIRKDLAPFLAKPEELMERANENNAHEKKKKRSDSEYDEKYQKILQSYLGE